MKKDRQFTVKLFVIVVALLAAAGTLWHVQAEAAEKIRRIGFLSLTPRDSFQDSFYKGLRELGYVEGKNLAIQSRFAAANPKRLAEGAAQLAELRVDVIVARGTQATLAAKRATATIPIVMTGNSDPVGTGLVASLARPGGNVTGMSILAPDLAQKRMELLRRMMPRASRAAVLWNPTNAGNVNEWRQTEAAAKKLQLTLVSREVRQPKDINRAFKALSPATVDAVVTLTDAILSSGRTEIVQFATNSRLPGMFHLRDFVEQGGLVSYGPDLHHSFYRAAYYVDQILKGTHPADMPVEQPIKFELAINLQTAKQIGLSVPADVLVLADKVIK